MGSGRIHVHLTDAGGDPDWHDRFRDLMAFTDDDVPEGDPDKALKAMRRFPVRWAMRSMARGGRRGHRRARFLFALALCDFGIFRAARLVSPAGLDEHGAEWAVSYAGDCLHILRRKVTDPERTHADGSPRSFVQRRIGKSEAQATAETAPAGALTPRTTPG